jgi:hypothetical protein
MAHFGRPAAAIRCDNGVARGGATNVLEEQ